jgi:hypothetical protein
MRQIQLAHQFVDFIPERLEDGVLYISRQYGTAVHKCCCGCSEEVVTPLNPTDWSLQVDNNLVTLYPSIGNWSFACQSHYWIRRSKVIWAGRMSPQMIARGRADDRAAKQAYFDSVNRQKSQHSPISRDEVTPPNDTPGLLHSLWSLIKRSWK